MPDVETTASFDGLAQARYVRLTTYRRDGTPVATPVWFALGDGALYAWTGEDTGKVKRIRNEPRVTVGPCNARGTPTGPAYAASARVLAAGEGRRAYGLLKARYRSAAAVYGAIGLLGRLTRRGRGFVGIAVEPAATVDLPAPP
ncbi:MAG TPA: PPOX class F420-dependent oxidoreductase [Acidimicrobiales bacterium]|nr:PPOX class F420-dependent oxidoreductase [Acidimicrobiales bacterium]